MKGALLNKMPGLNLEEKIANLRTLYGYMWAHPGKKLLFMGGEFGQWREWNEEESLDWHLIEEPFHGGVQKLVRELNQLYKRREQMWEADGEPSGFQWIDADNASENIVSFRRISPKTGREVVVVGNFSPVARENHQLGLPRTGNYRLILNTDAAKFGGSGVEVAQRVKAKDEPLHGLPYSATINLPPMATLWFDAPAKHNRERSGA